MIIWTYSAKLWPKENRPQTFWGAIGNSPVHFLTGLKLFASVLFENLGLVIPGELCCETEERDRFMKFLYLCLPRSWEGEQSCQTFKLLIYTFTKFLLEMLTWSNLVPQIETQVPSTENLWKEISSKLGAFKGQLGQARNVCLNRI